MFPLSSVSRPALRPTQLPIQWVPVDLSGGGEGGKARPERDADHSPHLVPRSRMSTSYTSYLSWHLHDLAGPLYLRLNSNAV
jgi:hypothetical protein